MSKQWPSIRLSEVLEVCLDQEPVDPTEEYRMAGVYSFGKGMFNRGVLKGSDTKYKVLNRLHRDYFVVSQPKGWEGALAIVPPKFDGWYLSPVFPTFKAKQDMLDISFLGWYCKQAKVWQELQRKTHGIGARRESVLPRQFLSLQIPLPPLSEQRRIVARIEELASRIEEARRLREEALKMAQLMPESAARTTLKPKEHWIKRPIACSCTMSTGTTPPTERTDLFNGNLKWYTPADLGESKWAGSSARKLSEDAVDEGKARVFEPNTVLLVSIGASLGKVALAKERCSANQQITGLLFSSAIHPDYAYWWIRSLASDFLKQAPKATLPIINQRRIGQFSIAYPPTITEQEQIAAYLDDLDIRLDKIHDMQSKTSKNLDALLPSILDKAFKGEL